MHTRDQESAISDFVGVLLMVFLTVVMGALIVMNVSGLMQGVPQTRTVALTADQSPDLTSLQITYHGGPDHASLLSLTIRWPDGTEEPWSGPAVGASRIATNAVSGPQNVTSGPDRVLVIGHFQDNYDQIVLDTML